MSTSTTAKSDPAKSTNEKPAGEGSASKQAETKQESTTQVATANTPSTDQTNSAAKKEEEKPAGKDKQVEGKEKSANRVPSTQKKTAKTKFFLKEKKKKAKTVDSENESDSDSDSSSSDSEVEKKKLDKKAKKSKSKTKTTKSKKKADSSDLSSDTSDSSDSEKEKAKEKDKKAKDKAEAEKAVVKKAEEDEKAKGNKKDEQEKEISNKLGLLGLIATKQANKATDDTLLKQQIAQQHLLIQFMQQQMQRQAMSGLGSGMQVLGPGIELPIITSNASEIQALGISSKPAVTLDTNLLSKISEFLIEAKKEETKENADAPVAADTEKKAEEVKIVRASILDFKRIDRVYDASNRYYKFQDTTDDKENFEYDRYIFNVRRDFGCDNKYQRTTVDVKSKLLVEALKELMDGVEGLSLVDDTPRIDPDILFLYLEDFRKLYKQLKKRKVTAKNNKKQAKKDNETKRTHLKLLLDYLDKEYSETKKSLYPMLESGLITFEFLWALWKPSTIAWATTYNTIDQPRAFKIGSSEKKKTVTAGEYYKVDGKYLEYDGKVFGMGEVSYTVKNFKGAQKITSLDCYPIKYHKDEAKARSELIARGKKFVSLHGVQYKSHEGLAYVKKRQQILKINIDSRIMVDPAIFRRTLPNYQISTVKAQDPDILDDPDESDDSDKSDETDEEKVEDDKPKMKRKIVQNSSDSEKFYVVRVPVNDDGMEMKPEHLKEVASKKKRKAVHDKKAPPIFKDEEYLIASPVVLGFSFAEKEFLEFTVSGVKEIAWNEGSYESLVLPENTKAIVRGLVESHKNHPEEGIDDVIQGKGKGLVAVLHGPPGTGKTLTAEGISELLKCPLYMVSVGELGTNPRTLEGELHRVLDIAHAWGAVLLLDEADVFLEQRTVQDIHRNALVSIFLRLLEYFQGILFLTTNRVATFDEAFQSRIHIALKYGELTHAAKKSVFKLFIERVRVSEGLKVMPFTEENFDTLAKRDLNGRQIKNTVRTAQALAINESEPLSMVHIKRVLDVAQAFEHDLKGGGSHDHQNLYR